MGSGLERVYAGSVRYIRLIPKERSVLSRRQGVVVEAVDVRCKQDLVVNEKIRTLKNANRSEYQKSNNL